MRKIMEYGVVFTVGGIIYVIIELLFRGYSHWTMAIVGGMAVLGIYLISAMKESTWKKWIMDTALILAIEFVAGIIIIKRNDIALLIIELRRIISPFSLAFDNSVNDNVPTDNEKTPNGN